MGQNVRALHIECCDVRRVVWFGLSIHVDLCCVRGSEISYAGNDELVRVLCVCTHWVALTMSQVL